MMAIGRHLITLHRVPSLLSSPLYLQPSRFHRCQTLVYKSGLPVRKRPETGIGGERLVQDLLIEGHTREREEEEDTTPKK